MGRKNTLRVGALTSTVGAILQFSATTFSQLIVGRVINGVGNGFNSSTCGVYQAESCRGVRRGKLSVIVVLHNVIFYCFASWLTLACSYSGNGAQWRLPLALQLVPCMFLVGLLPLLPESPRWLLNHDRVEEAQEALRRYLGKDLSADDPMVQDELKSIMGAIQIERRSKISFKEVILCRDRSGHLKRLLLGCGGQFMQQFGGINALNYYFPIILTKNLGLSTLLARILTGANATSYMISSGLAFWMIERFGRRSLMMSGLALQCLAYVMVALSVGLLNTAPFQWGAVAITFLFFYYAAFGWYVPLRSLFSVSQDTDLPQHMGYGSVGISGRSGTAVPSPLPTLLRANLIETEFPRYADSRCCRRHCDELALRLRVHAIHPHRD